VSLTMPMVVLEWMGVECKTLTRARCRPIPEHANPPKLRSVLHTLGLPDVLSHGDREATNVV